MPVDAPPRPIHRQEPCICCDTRPEGCRDIGSIIECLIPECICTAMNGDYCEACIDLASSRRTGSGR